MIKDILSRNRSIVKWKQRLDLKFRRLISTLSPTIASKIMYKRAFGKKINLDNPATLSEKLTWLKLNTYYNNPLVTMCADKYMVREYVAKCNLGEILNELIAAWDSVDEIEWESLPDKFVIKCNHGAGYNIICDNKKNFNVEEAKLKLQEWMKEDYWKMFAEVNYKYIKKKIICEKYLDTNQGFVPCDYKIYCFNGEPKAILVMMDRDKEIRSVFMSPEWKFISAASKYKSIDVLPEMPYSLNKMVEAATKLSSPFPFVRVDFYQYKDRAIFGEMTFTPAGGLFLSRTDIDGIPMDEILDISYKEHK